MGRNKQQSKVKLSRLTFHKLNWLEYITMGLGLWFFVLSQTIYAPFYGITLYANYWAFA